MYFRSELPVIKCKLYKIFFSKKAMFVVDPFKGEAYKKLVAENCRIYGSGALISSLALKGTFKIRENSRFQPILY